ncbi:MAG TPA: SIMPL domain-containing protein [Nannocystis sp.]
MQTRDKSEQGTIEAIGQGAVSATPDVAILRLGVTTEAKKPADAAKQNAERMNKVLEAIKKVGIKEEAIQTWGMRLQPVMKWDEADNKHVLLGYRADNIITVRTPVERAGEVYDAGIQGGANAAGGIMFSLQDETKYRRDALMIATQRAVEEIQVVADTIGATLIGPVQAQVMSSGSYHRPMSGLALEKAAADTPVLPGQLEIDAQVRVVFAIK